MQIVSTMGSGSLGREIDLEVLVRELNSHLNSPVEANFQSGSIVTVRLEEGGPAYTIYRTGTIQIRGAKSKEHLMESSNRFRKLLEEIDFETPNFEFEQVTAVFMEDLEGEINLEALALALQLENIEYEPEQFPGLIYKPPHTNITLLIFATGKIIVNGTIDRTEAENAIRQLKENTPQNPPS